MFVGSLRAGFRAALAAVAAAGLSVTALAQPVQGLTDGEIVIASVQDLSGPIASVGGPVRDGMTLAAEEINAAGGINGRKLRVLVEDSAYDPKKGVLVAQKLLTQDRVFALLNVLGSAVTQAVAPMALDRNVPFLFAMVGSELSYLPQSPLKFGLNAVSSEHMRAAVKFAHDKLGRRRFGILYQDDEAGIGAMRAAEEQLKVHGLSLIEKTNYKRGDTNFSSQIARLKAADLDFLLLGTIVRETAGAAIEAKAQGWKVGMMIPWTTTQAVISLGGDAVDGLYGASQFLNEAQELTPDYRALVERFRARFGKEPMGGANYGYISVMLFAEAAKNAGRNLTPATLAQALEQVKNFKTAFAAAPISYSPDSHAPPRAAFIMQVRSGKWVQVDGPLTY